jgi:hypothetical protein
MCDLQAKLPNLCRSEFSETAEQPFHGAAFQAGIASDYYLNCISVDSRLIPLSILGSNKTDLAHLRTDILQYRNGLEVDLNSLENTISVLFEEPALSPDQVQFIDLRSADVHVLQSCGLWATEMRATAPITESLKHALWQAYLIASRYMRLALQATAELLERVVFVMRMAFSGPTVPEFDQGTFLKERSFFELHGMGRPPSSGWAC